MSDTQELEGCQLYLVSPPKLVITSFAEDLRACFDAGEVAAFQLRMKDTGEDDIRRAAQLIQPLCEAYEIAFILNDDMKLAKSLGADGVHLGKGDGSILAARKLLGPDATIGASCYNSMDLAFAAGEAGADYVAFGAFHPTTTKADTVTAGVDLIERWIEIAELPCVAIGGITPENAAPIIKAGADFIAVSGAVWNHATSPAAAIAAFSRVLAL